MSSKNNMLGPATDLVISLFSLALILVGIVSGLYLETVNQQVKEMTLLEQKVDANLSLEEQIKKYKDIITKLNQQISLLKNKNNSLNEKIQRLLNENQSLVDEIEKLRKELAEQLLLNQEIQRQLTKSESTVEKLSEGHKNTDIPKRSTENKIIHRVYVEETSNNTYEFFYKPENRQTRDKLSQSTLHKKLAQAQKLHGKNLYVSVIIPDNFSVKKAKQFRCEFWAYDYYEYFEKTYCQ